MHELQPFLCYPLPEWLESLADLALDLRWTWHHGSDPLWKAIDPSAWETTRNPWWLLQSISKDRIKQLAGNQQFKVELQRMVNMRQEYLRQPTWFQKNYSQKAFGTIAYFSIEFGVGEALPLYAGGLGVLAGDYLKTASDFGIPMVGIGLLYQEGYFHQVLDGEGWQIAAHPHNDPTNLPIKPVTDSSGGWLQVPLELPGRILFLRVWQAQVGRVKLYLLDSNVPTNHPNDRSITYKLYDDRPEVRLIQEMALGIAGWKVIKALALPVDVCHLNEGHTAFMILERTRSFMNQTGQPFPEALLATRAGNIFTTHTPVAAGIDNFRPELIRHFFRDYASSLGISIEQLLALGRKDLHNSSDNFNMAILAMHGSIFANGVSQLHGNVSRTIFQPLYPRWPEREVPVVHITNGVHMPSWDSKWAESLWMENAGNGYSGDKRQPFDEAIRQLSDGEIWSLRNAGRCTLIGYVRQQLEQQLIYSQSEQKVEQVNTLLDEGALTLGFARRFAAYKRPDLLLRDPARLTRLLTDKERPVQLIVSGKAHPQDEEGKRLVQRFVNFARQPEVMQRVVFLPDYDIGHAKQLVQGVDLWINTPRRPWEACGTSGMKVLVNGGLNLSELDGWWAEAYSPDVGWALGDGREHSEPGWDEEEAGQLYDLLEQKIIPEFYDRDAQGIPSQWIKRIRTSIGRLAPQFNSHRMICEYIEKAYLPAAARYRERTAQGTRLAKELSAWQKAIARYWPELHFGRAQMRLEEDKCIFEVPVYTGEMDPEFINVELYANPFKGQEAVCLPLSRGDKLNDGVKGYIYKGAFPANKNVDQFTLRVIPSHPAACVPLEENHILWER